MPGSLGKGLEEEYPDRVNMLPTRHPDPTEQVRQHWQEDELFGYQFLNGANPMLLRRCTSLPSRLVLSSGMEALRAQLEKELEVPSALCCSLLGGAARAVRGGPKDGGRGGRLCQPAASRSRLQGWENPEKRRSVGDTRRSSQRAGATGWIPGAQKGPEM